MAISTAIAMPLTGFTLTHFVDPGFPKTSSRPHQNHEQLLDLGAQVQRRRRAGRRNDDAIAPDFSEAASLSPAFMTGVSWSRQQAAGGFQVYATKRWGESRESLQ